MKWFFLGLFCLGIGLFIHSLSMPEYVSKDAKAEKERLDNEAGDLLRENKFSTNEWKEFEKKYYPTVMSLKTHKNIFMDLGLGIVSLSLTCFVFCLRIKSLKGIRGLQTPIFKKLVWMAHLSWIGTIPACVIYYIRTFLRYDYPWFADSTIIPMTFQIVEYVIGLPIIIFAMAWLGKRSQYPAIIFSKFSLYGIKSVAYEILFLFPLIILFENLTRMTRCGDFLSVPIDLIGIYVVLSLRAGVIRKNNEAQTVVS